MQKPTNITTDRRKMSLILNISTAVGLLLMALFVFYGLKTGIFTSQNALEQFLKSLGIWGPLIFIAIQVIQVVIPILPGAIGCLAGVLVFGPFTGFLYNYIGISIGSVLAFLIAKRCGQAFVKNLVKPATYTKYANWLEKGNKFDKLFAIAIFLPVAPDDFLCYLAGLTRMTVQKFTAIIILCKPASIFLYSLGLTSITQLMKIIF